MCVSGVSGVRHSLIPRCSGGGGRMPGNCCLHMHIIKFVYIVAKITVYSDDLNGLDF